MEGWPSQSFGHTERLVGLGVGENDLAGGLNDIGRRDQLADLSVGPFVLTLGKLEFDLLGNVANHDKDRGLAVPRERDAMGFTVEFGAVETQTPALGEWLLLTLQGAPTTGLDVGAIIGSESR